MPGYLLVRANNLYGSYVEGQTPVLLEEKGAVVEVRHVDDGFGAKETLPTFVRVKLSDGNLSDLEQYGENWKRVIDWQVLNFDAVNDVYQLRIFSTNPGTSNKGAVIRADIEQLIIDWNGSIASDTVNEVVANLSVYDAATSLGFWELPAVAAVTFTSIDYNQATGDHTIQANYGATGAKARNVDQLVRRKGATVLSHANKVITFVINRSNLTAQFKTELLQKSELVVQKRRFTVPATQVDAAIAAGGELTVTLSQVQTNIVDGSQ